MYKAITSFWSKSSNIPQSSSSSISDDEDSWVFVSKTESSLMKPNNAMTNSWIASPPLIKIDELSSTIHHFNPIENLLIEHASMSVYEQIASKTRQRRQKQSINDTKLDEQTEEDEDEDDDEIVHDDDDKTSMNINPRTMNSSISTLESSTSSLMAHHRHLNRLHYRRKRSTNEPKQILNKNLERQRLNHPRTSKILLQQTSRLNQ